MVQLLVLRSSPAEPLVLVFPVPPLAWHSIQVQLAAPVILLPEPVDLLLQVVAVALVPEPASVVVQAGSAVRRA